MVELDLKKFTEQVFACKTVEQLNEPIIDGKTLLQSAASQGFIRHCQAVIDKAKLLQEVETVVDCRAGAAHKFWTPLFFAINSGPNGHPDVVSMLLKYKCQVNQGDADGKTALNCASEFGQDDTIELLL